MRTLADRPVVEFTKYAWQELRDIVFSYDGDESGAGLSGRRGRDGSIIIERVLAAEQPRASRTRKRLPLPTRISSPTFGTTAD